MAETIGVQLKQAREAKNLTIQKVVQATHIRAQQIEAIEADDFDSLPSLTQARAFLKLYAEFLGVSLDDVIAHQRKEVLGIGGTSTDAPAFPPVASISTSESEVEQPLAKTVQDVDVLSKLLFRLDQLFHKQSVLTGTKDPVEMVKEEASTADEMVQEPAPQAETPSPIIEILASKMIFTSIGKTLEQRRESLSLTLDEIERHTHVRKHYLIALEGGDFAGLPSSVQARGMLSNYAHFLNLDVDAILLTFAEGLQAQLLERQSTQVNESDNHSSKFLMFSNLPFTIKIPSFVRRYISVDILVGGGLIILLLSFAIWGTNRIIGMRAGSTPQPTAPPMLSIFQLPTDAVSISPEPDTTGNPATTDAAVAVNTLAVTLPAAGNGPVQVVVIAQNSAYVRVTVDGKVQFEGRVTAGTAYPYDGNIQIEVLTGNGRAISILYNQNNLGPMGDIGEVVDHIYTTTEILNPTATFTPTATITPTPTITLRPSATVQPSATPRPSITPRPTQTP